MCFWPMLFSPIPAFRLGHFHNLAESGKSRHMDMIGCWFRKFFGWKMPGHVQHKITWEILRKCSVLIVLHLGPFLSGSLGHFPKHEDCQDDEAGAQFTDSGSISMKAISYAACASGASCACHVNIGDRTQQIFWPRSRVSCPLNAIGIPWGRNGYWWPQDANRFEYLRGFRTDEINIPHKSRPERFQGMQAEIPASWKSGWRDIPLWGKCRSTCHVPNAGTWLSLLGRLQLNWQ